MTREPCLGRPVPRWSLTRVQIEIINSISNHSTFNRESPVASHMPALDISEPLARKLDDLSMEDTQEDVLWKAMYLYERNEFPSE